MPVAVEATPQTDQLGSLRAQWLGAAAAFLGWMFDGFEMGIFPLVARPALQTMMPQLPALGQLDALEDIPLLIAARPSAVPVRWPHESLLERSTCFSMGRPGFEQCASCSWFEVVDGSRGVVRTCLCVFAARLVEDREGLGRAGWFRRAAGTLSILT